MAWKYNPIIYPDNEGYNKEAARRFGLTVLYPASPYLWVLERLRLCECPSLAALQSVKFQILYLGDETVCILLYYFIGSKFNYTCHRSSLQGVTPECGRTMGGTEARRAEGLTEREKERQED